MKDTSTSDLTAASAIANRLAAEGCRHAFGMPGGEVLVLLDALREAGVDFTLCKHENAAGYMAEGSWQVTGAPGILLTTVGPGLANAINTVANALQEQVPLIVLSGCIGDAEAAQFTHQVIDQRAMMTPVTKATFRVAPGTAGLVIEKALSVALADPPGPVHIDLPVDLATSRVSVSEASAIVREPAKWGQGASLEAAIAKLAGAKRPILLAGLGAVHHDAGEAITRLCTENNIPMLTTYKAKGVMDERHPLCLGGHGLSPKSDTFVLPLLEQSDCVILAGYDPIEMRSGWIRPWAGENAIEIMHGPVEHGMHASAVRFVGDVAQAIEALGAGLTAPLSGLWPGGEPTEARRGLKAAFTGPDRWGPHQIYATLNEALPEGGICTADSGAHRILLSQMWQSTGPGQFLQSACFCTMGVAVPLATGIVAADPGRPVIAVVGDAGFDMSPGDLATLRDLESPMVIVVPVDDSLALIEKKQAAMQIMKHGVSFNGSDIPAIATAYGGHGAVVNTRETLFAELNDAWQRRTFTVLACPIDKGDYDGAF